MPFSLSDYIAQTVSRYGNLLGPEIIQALEESYTSGAASEIIAGIEARSASIEGERAVAYSGGTLT